MTPRWWPITARSAPRTTKAVISPRAPAIWPSPPSTRHAAAPCRPQRAIVAEVRGLAREEASRVALWWLVSDPGLDVLDQARTVSEVVGMSARASADFGST